MADGLNIDEPQQPQHQPPQGAAVVAGDGAVAGPASPPHLAVQEPEPGPSSPSAAQRREEEEEAGEEQQNLDSLIARMQRDMDMRIARGNVEAEPFSPPPPGEQQQDDGRHLLTHIFLPTFHENH